MAVFAQEEVKVGLKSDTQVVSREVAVEAHRFRRDFLIPLLARVRTHRPGRNPPPP
jgi:hypothetical protein